MQRTLLVSGLRVLKHSLSLRCNRRITPYLVSGTTRGSYHLGCRHILVSAWQSQTRASSSRDATYTAVATSSAAAKRTVGKPKLDPLQAQALAEKYGITLPHQCSGCGIPLQSADELAPGFYQVPFCSLWAARLLCSKLT